MTTALKYWVLWASMFLMVTYCVPVPVPSSAAQQVPQFGPAGYLPYVPNNYCSGQRSTEIPFGTQVYGTTGYVTPHFRLLQDSNSSWLRNTINWLSVEPDNVAPDQFKWSSVDRTLNAAKQNCMNMIVTIDGTPSWARLDGSIDGRTPFKPENLPDFVEFVTALVERYNGDGADDAPSGIKITDWEFYNEPDFGSEVAGHEGWGNYGKRYAEMLAAIYEPIHLINPDAKVLLGGLAYSQFVSDGGDGVHVRDFLKDVLDAGGGAYFDVLNFHYYPFQHNRMFTNTNSSGLVEKYASIKEIMDSYDVEKPLIITEIGYHSSARDDYYPGNQEFQARRVVELLTQGISLGSEVTIWWSFYDEGQSFPYKTGLTTAGEKPAAKLSYGVYQEVIRRLGNSEFVETTVKPTAQNDLEAYRFRNKSTNRFFYVAWLNPVVPITIDSLASFNDGATQNLELPGEKATLFSKESKQVGVINDGDDGNNDGKVNVAIGRNPLYIEIME